VWNVAALQLGGNSCRVATAQNSEAERNKVAKLQSLLRSASLCSCEQQALKLLLLHL